MRRCTLWVLLVLAGCSNGSSGSGTESGAAPTGTPASTAGSAAATGAAAAEAAEEVEARILAFAAAVRGLAREKCDDLDVAPSCNEPKRLAWLKQNVDWELYGTAEVIVDLASAESPAPGVAEIAVRDIDAAATTLLASHSATIGQRIAAGTECTVAAADEEDKKEARTWLETKPPEWLAPRLLTRVEAPLARRKAVQKIYSVRCGAQRLVIGWVGEQKAAIFPMTR